MTVYEVFEFKDGHSMWNIEGPFTYIAVGDGEDKFKVLERLGLPGNTYGYGLREILDLEVEVTRLADWLTPKLAAEDALNEIYNELS